MIDVRYWDSNCFLAWMKREPGRVDDCDAIIQMANRGDVAIVTSAITLAEVIRPTQKGHQQLPSTEEALVQAFFRRPFLRFVDFNPTMGASSRELQWRYNLGVRDSIHVASAMAATVPVLETYDLDLLALSKASIPGCPEIRQPKPGGQRKLAITP